MERIIVDPVTRIEGHLKLEVEIDNGVVTDAKTGGTLWRGFELILQGRDPRDAAQLIQRICGVCPTGHATAGMLSLDNAAGIEPPPNGRILRNLIFGSNYLQSHILHFFHLAALDYVRGPNVAPFTPRYEGDYRLTQDINDQAVAHYIEALTMRRKAHEMLAIWGGRIPHVQAMVPGGVTEHFDAQKVYEFLIRLEEITTFIDNVYVPTVKAVAEVYSDWFDVGRGCMNMLCYGGFPQEEGPDHVAKAKFFPAGVKVRGQRQDLDYNQITEDVTYSWFKDGISLDPKEAVLEGDPEKKNAYSYMKAPRYNGEVMEVGPLARMIIAEDPTITALGDRAYSVMGRHLARAVECSNMAHAMATWVTQLEYDQPVATPYKVPKDAQGVGLTEASRGALGHWHKIENGRTSIYNAVVPTTWNSSPRDARGTLGPMEQAIVGTVVNDTNNPVELVRIIRSFDPCYGCAIHLMTPDKKVISQFQIG